MAKTRYFNGVPLIDNLYTDNRKRKGHWRYRWPDGSFQNFKAETVQKANAFAIEANQVREQRPQKESPENALPYWAEKYIEHREAMDPALANKSSWVRRNRAAIREFANQFGGTPVFILSLKHIRPWWDSLSGNSQRNKKPELNRFCNHLIAEEVTNNLQPHPFNILMMRPVAHKKRVRMALEEYWAIYNKAPELGLGYIQDAMAIALLTFMRRSDLCSLRFDEHTNGQQLWKVISKAAAQGKPKRLIWNFSKWPELRTVVARCRERSMKHKRCPFLLSREPERKIMGDTKDHYYQVLPDMLSDDFAKARDATGLYINLPAAERPGMHEIRALGSHLYEDESDQSKVMNAMAHSDIEMTRHYQSGHKVEEIEIGIEELSVAKLGGHF